MKMRDALLIVEGVRKQVKAVPVEAGNTAAAELHSVLAKNGGFETTLTIRDVLEGAHGASCYMEPKLIPHYQFVPFLSVNV